MRVLILGGTGEARALAATLVPAHDVTTSLAGRVSSPRLPLGAVRIGGFGGVAGLREAATRFDAVVDATHPFAATISAHAAAACPRLVRLQRPGWSAADVPTGTWVSGHAQAAALAAATGSRPFLTVGRQSLGDFVGPLAGHAALVRVVEEPDVALPRWWRLLRGRGPYRLAGERDLMQAHEVDVLVTKDSGGAMTRAKLDAAAALGVPVVLVRRPAPPAGVTTVGSVAEVVAWLGASS